MAPPCKIRTACLVDGCETVSKYGDYCGKHYKRMWRHGDPSRTDILMDNANFQCEVGGCEEVAKTRRMCAFHFSRWKSTGRTYITRAENGSGSVNAGGYRMLSINGERKYEHILVAERALGKPLPSKAVVHHITEDPLDNYGWMKLVICPDQAYHLLIHRLMREKGISFREVDPEIAALDFGDL